MACASLYSMICEVMMTRLLANGDRNEALAGLMSDFSANYISGGYTTTNLIREVSKGESGSNAMLL